VNINVPSWAQAHFWEEPPAGAEEFWAFRFAPPCRPGDALVFRFDGVVVAQAVCDRVEPPGESRCDHSGGWEFRYKVFWRPETFVDLRANKVRS
jgi:hypothetical protein